MKSINFLTNIASVGINKEDFYNESFIFDVYLLITKNLNPFSSLDQKLNDQNKHEMIYIPTVKNVLQRKVSEIITDFLKEENQNYIELRNNLSQYKNFSVHMRVFAEINCSTKRRGFNLKSTFDIMLKTYKDTKRH